ncbi:MULTISPECIES: hypothetical protein [Cryobacterium]|uniref:hypothetical protein n=1 Tax=Cryobacterium TaxID=69578 RepID=UPI00141B6911|nr:MULTISPECIES: hypothetical protein [Cryobacterium]
MTETSTGIPSRSRSGWVKSVGLIDVVMTANLLIMVIIGGCETEEDLLARF